VTTLVTGANGFLGRYLVEQLVDRGESVRAMVRQPDAQLASLGVEIFLADLGDAAALAGACQGVHTVHHTAAIAGIWGPWKTYYETNTLGTVRLLEAARNAGVRRFVYTSSPSVTFDGRDQCNVDESAPYARRWLAHYPRSKALAEQAVLAAHGVEGLSTCALRPHLIWGPRDRHLIPRLMERAKEGKLLRVGDGTNLVDMIYVENAAMAQILAADALDGIEDATPGSASSKGSGGKAYFLSQGEPVNCWDWINEVLALADVPPVKKSISRCTAWVAGSVQEVVHTIGRLNSEPRMTRFLAAQLATSHYFDISAARRDFGYEPKVTTEQGMQRLAARL